MAQARALVGVLKQVLKSRGVTYAEIARRLGMSEASIKRVFAKGSFTLERLDKICDVLGIEITDLAKMVEHESERVVQLTLQQEKAIVADPKLMLVAVHALGGTGGHCDDQDSFRHGLFGHESGIEEGVVNTPDEARRAVRFNIKYGADVIKTCASGGVLSPTDDVDVPQLSQEELNGLVEEAHTLRRKTAAHAHGAEAAKRAIRAGIDSIEHGTFLDDEALQMMHDRGTFLVPTLTVRVGIAESRFPPLVQAKADAAMKRQDAMMKRAVALGVKIESVDVCSRPPLSTVVGRRGGERGAAEIEISIAARLSQLGFPQGSGGGGRGADRRGPARGSGRDDARRPVLRLGPRVHGNRSLQQG